VNTRPALNAVSLTIEAGEIVGVSGQSGSGKTTIALAILGLLPRDAKISGEIRYRDRNLLTLQERELEAIRGAEIGMVFQESALALSPMLTVGAQIAEVVRAHTQCDRKAARERALAAMIDVGFGESIQRIFDAYPHELSGGQRQRVLIAQAIVCRPQLVIADEPTASLDSQVKDEVLRLIRRLNDRHGTAFLLISHSADVLSSTTHRTVTIGREHTKGATRISREALISDSHLATARGRSSSTLDVIVEATNVTKTYRQSRLLSRSQHQVQALAGMNLRITRGSAVGLAGDSGCGKSTLARCLAGLESPDSGEVCINGRNIAQRHGRDLLPFRNQVQLIFQDSAAALNPRFSALDVITEPMVIQGTSMPAERRLRAIDLMLQVGLPADRLRSRASEFSGGERQRLAIARALAVRPQMLILDESFSGLDVETRTRVGSLLISLQETEGLTLLCISHDLGLLADFSSELVIMHRGRFEERREIDRFVRVEAAVA
jgi:peptide/nickel transport system ATP-binding protein